MAQKSKIILWIEATRTESLAMTLAGAMMAGALAYKYGTFSWPAAVLVALTSLSLHLACNLANDLGDYRQGTDLSSEAAAVRPIVRGDVSPAYMQRWTVICTILSAVFGTALVFTAFGFNDWLRAGIFLALGLICILAALYYTLGKKPYGYSGWGDVAVFATFGLVAVCGGFYVIAKELWWQTILPATGLGLLVVAVLNINNIRDMYNDEKYKKYTVALKFGEKGAKYYQLALVLLSLASFAAFSALNYTGAASFLYLLSFVALLWQVKKLFDAKTEKSYTFLLQSTSLACLVITILFIVTVISGGNL